MTRDEILNMPAGREMDALVGKMLGLDVRLSESWVGDLSILGVSDKVTFVGEFTAEREWVDEGDFYYVDANGSHRLLDYSTDIAAAWSITDKFYSVDLMRISNGTIYECYVVKKTNKDGHANAETAPLAICRAALLAVTEGDK